MSNPTSHKALSDLVAWCDKNDWGTVPEKLEAACRNALLSGPAEGAALREAADKGVSALWDAHSFLLEIESNGVCNHWGSAPLIDRLRTTAVAIQDALKNAAPQSAGADRGPLDPTALYRAAFELQRHFGREGSIYGIKACEEIARIALVVYQRDATDRREG